MSNFKVCIFFPGAALLFQLIKLQKPQGDTFISVDTTILDNRAAYDPEWDPSLLAFAQKKNDPIWIWNATISYS